MLSSRTLMLIGCHCARQCPGLWQSASTYLTQQQQQREFSAAAEEGDKIVMKGLVFHGYHGALPEVRGGGLQVGSSWCRRAQVTAAGGTLSFCVNGKQQC